MKNLYAKFVLWLIGPALDIRKKEEDAAALAVWRANPPLRLKGEGLTIT